MGSKGHFAMKQHKAGKAKNRPLNYQPQRSQRNIEALGTNVEVHEFLKDEDKLSVHKLLGARSVDAPAKKQGRVTSKKQLRKSGVAKSIEDKKDEEHMDIGVDDMVAEFMASSAPDLSTLSQKQRRKIEKDLRVLQKAIITSGPQRDEKARPGLLKAPPKPTCLKKQVIRNQRAIGDLWAADISDVAVGRKEKKFVGMKKFDRNARAAQSPEAPSGRIDRQTLQRTLEPSQVLTQADAVSGSLREVKLDGDEAIVACEDNKTRRQLIPDEDIYKLISDTKIALSNHKYNVKYLSGGLFQAYKEGLLIEPKGPKFQQA